MRIALVEDEPEMAGAIKLVLEREGYIVDHFDSLAGLIEASEVIASDLVLLDRTLPDGDGITVIGSLRALNPDVPVIVLTARGGVADRIAGLDCGADDYLAKPFSMEEMLARIRAVRRRPAILLPQHIELGDMVYDVHNEEALVRGARLDLPRRELRVLSTLMRRRGLTVVRSALEDSVYGLDDDVQPNTLDSHVSRLRKRLAEADAGVEIHTIRGVGYLMRSCR